MLVNAKWCRENPTDYGLTVHEISHAVQCYPTYDNAWLVEGISDYVRWVKFQPKDFDWGLNLKKSTYHDSYRTTAAFLGWCSIHYDSGLVTKLNAALRAGKYNDALFKTYCGKDADTLWAEFVADYKLHAKAVLDGPKI